MVKRGPRFVAPRRLQTEPPAGVFERWQPELDRIASGIERPARLLLRWVSGYPWQPIERWYIYQLVPLRFLGGLGPAGAVRDYLLHGPDPARVIAFDRVKMRVVALERVRPPVDPW